MSDSDTQWENKSVKEDNNAESGGNNIAQNKAGLLAISKQEDKSNSNKQQSDSKARTDPGWVTPRYHIQQNKQRNYN